MATQVLPETKSDTHRPIASRWHLLVVLAVQAALSFRGAIRAGQMHDMVNPDRIGIYERTMFFEWLVLGLVLAGVWLHGSTLFTVLGDRWRSLRQFLQDIGIAVFFLIASIMLDSVVGSLLRRGGDDHAAQFLLPHGGAEMALWVALSITAGICEEAVYRGYLQRQFMALTKNVPAGIVLSAAAFGLAHSYQGFQHAFQIGLLGVMGGILAYWRKSVRPGMIAHTLQDVLGGLIKH